MSYEENSPAEKLNRCLRQSIKNSANGLWVKKSAELQIDSSLEGQSFHGLVQRSLNNIQKGILFTEFINLLRRQIQFISLMKLLRGKNITLYTNTVTLKSDTITKQNIKCLHCYRSELFGCWLLMIYLFQSQNAFFYSSTNGGALLLYPLMFR